MAIITLNNNSLSSVTSLPAGVGGKVLQIVQTTKTDTFSTTSTSFTDITGMSVSITPSATSSKILILCYLITSTGSVDNAGQHIKLLRGSTDILLGDASSSRTRATLVEVPQLGKNYGTNIVPIIYQDSPSTSSATTYKLQCMSQQGSAGFVVNRSSADDNNAYSGRGASVIMAMEVAG